GVFLKFQEAINALGLSVNQPSSVTNLTEPEKMQYIGQFNGSDTPMNWNISGSGITPLMGFESIQEVAPPPVALATGDLKPLITDDVRRRVTQSVAGAIRQTSIEERIDPAQLAFWIDSNFDALCDGVIFRFEPVYQALKDV